MSNPCYTLAVYSHYNAQSRTAQMMFNSAENKI